MTLLNFESYDSKSNGGKKSLKLVFGIGALVGVVALGSTLAASINLNAGTPVEFGQGVTQTVACDDSITITPFSSFVNADGAGAHKFTSLKISGIDSSSDKCSGKSFVIKAYGDNGILDIFNYTDQSNSENTNYNSIEISDDAGEFTWVSDGTDGDDVTQGSTSDITDTSFTLSFISDLSPITRTPLASAEDVKRITIESKDTTESETVTYSIGDTGPGGGKVFFVKSAGAFSYQFQDNQSEIESYEFACAEIDPMFCDMIPEPHYTTIALTSEEQAALPFDYLEVSTNNSTIIDWGSDGNVDGGTASKIGTGIANTANIASTFTSDTASNNAAKYVDQLELNGFSDWFLPSSDELHLILRLDIASQSGGPNIGSYPGNHWASTQDTSTTAHLRQYSGTESLFASISRTYGFGRVLAVRAF